MGSLICLIFKISTHNLENEYENGVNMDFANGNEFVTTKEETVLHFSISSVTKRNVVAQKCQLFRRGKKLSHFLNMRFLKLIFLSEYPTNEDTNAA